MRDCGKQRQQPEQSDTADLEDLCRAAAPATIERDQCRHGKGRPHRGLDDAHPQNDEERDVRREAEKNVHTALPQFPTSRPELELNLYRQQSSSFCDVIPKNDILAAQLMRDNGVTMWRRITAAITKLDNTTPPFQLH